MQTRPINKKSPIVNIAQAYQGFVDEPVPSIIFDAVEAGGTKRAFTIGLFVVAFLSGIGTTMLLGTLSDNAADTVLTSVPAEQLAISAHNTIALDQVYPVQVNTDDMSHLNSWLSYRLGETVSATQFEHLGYSLLGASLIPDGDTLSTLLVYENQQKTRVSLLTRYFGGNGEYNDITKARHQNINAIHWNNNGRQYALSSSLETDSLLSIHKSIANR